MFLGMLLHLTLSSLLRKPNRGFHAHRVYVQFGSADLAVDGFWLLTFIVEAALFPSLYRGQAKQTLSVR